MKIWQRIAFVFTALVLLVGCGSNQVRGNGKSITKPRTVQNFNQVKISGAYKVEITQGNQNTLKVTTDSNIVPLVITRVKNGQLSIHNKTGVSFSLTEPVIIQVMVKSLKGIKASGANELIVSNLKSSKLRLHTSGSIQADLSGKVKQLNMQISGSGKINAAKLVANNVKVRLIGSGEVMVNATDKLDTKITGSGSIVYSGNPDDVEQAIVGSGTLERIK